MVDQLAIAARAGSRQCERRRVGVRGGGALRLAVIGAGINGIMSAWALLDEGHQVVVFEQGEPVGATSSASTKTGLWQDARMHIC